MRSRPTDTLPTPFRPRPRRQRGQSLVEVCVACLVLIPLAIGIVYVGQYIHIKQVTQMAAREAAWDAALAPSTYEVKAPGLNAEQASLRARYFGDADSPIGTGQPAPRAFADAMLLDYSGQALLKPERMTLSEYSNEATPGLEGKFAGLAAKVTGALSKLNLSPGSQFPPDAKGYITARVDAETTKAARFEPFDKLDLDFHSQTVLLADAWNADGGGEDDGTGQDAAGDLPIPGRSVRRTITYLAPGTAVFGGGLGKFVNTVTDFIGSIPVLKDLFPGFDNHKFQLGRTAPDVVPYDKLKPYKGG